MTNSSRRCFLGFLGRTAAFLGIAGIPAISKASETENTDKLFVHHVFFWLKEPENPEVREIFEKALANLVTIESIYQSHIGIPASTRREVIDSSYTYSLLVTFRSEADHTIYQSHPIHDTFRNIGANLWNRVVVYDSVDVIAEK